MPLVEHLREARTRLLLSLAGVGVGTVVAWFFYDQIFAFMASPLDQLHTTVGGAHLNFETVSAAFDLKLRVSVFAGVLVSSPWWLYHVWAYIAPALHRKEKLYVIAFTVAGVILFSAGAASGVWIMPHAVSILASFAPEQSVMLMKTSVYFSFYMRLVIVFGVSFLVPLLMVGINQMGLVTARQMLKTWRWAVVIAFVFAAVANPLPDPWTMTIQALLLCSLYFGAVGIAAIHDRRVAKKRAKLEAEVDAALTGDTTEGE